MTYQVRKIGDHDWQDDDFPGRAPKIMSGYEYRVKPAPAAPKWPQTTLSEAEQMSLAAAYPCKLELIAKIANVALAHACETGLVVPSETVDKMMLQCHRREKELRDALPAATMKLAAIPSAQGCGVESALLAGMVERCLPAAKETLFYGLRFDEMSRDQLLAVAFKGWQLLQEARTPIDLACVS